MTHRHGMRRAERKTHTHGAALSAKQKKNNAEVSERLTSCNMGVSWRRSFRTYAAVMSTVENQRDRLTITSDDASMAADIRKQF